MSACDDTSSRFPAVVDNSMRKSLVRCQELAYWKHERGLVPVGENRVHLAAGKAFAAGLAAVRQAFYGEGIADPYDLLKIALAACKPAYDYTGPMPPYCYKTLDRVEGALAFYMDKWPFANDPLRPVRLNDGRLGIELCVSFPIPVDHPTNGSPLHYVANFDLLAIDDQSRYWIVDEKTTGKMGDSWALQWTLDAQLTGYCRAACILLQREGISDPRMAGAIIRGIAFHKADYAGMECLEPRQEWEMDRWYLQMLRDMQAWADAHKSGTHQMVMDHACALYNSPCEYARLCKSREPDKLLDGSFVVRHYNPLNRDEGS